ncbi:putative transcriptional regulator [Tenacibaculum maritimum]|uniref:helix-turn-helix domain-containing protein n=1 Tax=Tenacibaculum maritimum TaxID=107401 RepID=UPI0012E49217|nr:helix-turn-helix transcriptional regulator [Tenacibaculum maritimum]CAA0242607.1 putative transcriptional regulator [Tenacibaculum maritimum]
MNLGQRIQELRKKANLSQNDLAAKIEVSYPQMSRYEIKGVQPPADVLKRLADVFGVSIDYIVNGTLQEKAGSTLSDTELLQQFKEVELMDDSDKSTIKELINAFIAKRKIQSIL